MYHLPTNRAAPSLVAFALALLMLPAPARAANFFWQSDSGGAFITPQNWDPYDPSHSFIGPGGAGDTVNFDRGVATENRYTVVGVAGQNDRLLIHDDSLTLNFSGTYTLFGSSLDNPSFTVGVTAGDSGDVMLTGSGVLETEHSSIGHAAGSTGVATVDALQWVGTGDLLIGQTGSGTLTIQNGADVSDSRGILAGNTGSIGVVTVTGDGSTWTNSDSLTVGSNGTGTLTIADGGSVSNLLGAVGFFGSGSSAAIVTGDDSTWTNLSGLLVGVNGTGTLTVEDGGNVSSSNPNAAGAIGSSGTGAATIRGTGSNWTMNGPLVVGSFDGTGTLTIEAGGRVSNSNGTIGDDFEGMQGAAGAVTVTGPGSIWTNSGDLEVGEFGKGTLTITDGGEVVVGGSLLANASAQILLDGGQLTVNNFTAGGVNALDWQSGTLRLTSASGLTIGAGGLFGATLLLRPSQSLEVDNALTIENAATLFAASGLQVGSVVVDSGGQLFVGGATQQFSTGLTNHGDLVFNAESSVHGPVTNAAGGAITLLANVTFHDQVSGPGNFFGQGTATFAGGFSPGASPAEVKFETNVAFEQGNDLLMELGGHALGAEHDHLNIARHLALDGTLSVQLTNGFTPRAGDAFDLFDFGTLGGQFAQLSLPSLGGGLRWEASNLYTTGVLSVVPEPSTIWGFALLAAISVARRRR